jgi:ABC-type transporter Mla MlaB component
MNADLTLDGSCTLREVDAMSRALLGVATNEELVLLDGSAVSRIDTAGLQVLVSFARGLKESGKSIAWLGASSVLIESSKHLGVHDELWLPTPATGAGNEH